MFESKKTKKQIKKENHQELCLRRYFEIKKEYLRIEKLIIDDFQKYSLNHIFIIPQNVKTTFSKSLFS